METPGSQFLHQRDPNLHNSQEVQGVVDYLNQNGERVPNQPADKISTYLGFLANKDFVNDGILTGDQSSIDRQIDAHVIKTKEVPESYFDLQRRIAREQGHGDIEITPDMRSQLIEAVQADQRSGLAKWVEYLGGDDGGYPDWFKHYTWTSVTKLGAYDKEKHEFGKRSRATTAPYPELNREALAYVYDVLNKSRVRGERVDGGARDEQLQKLLTGGNFGKLYAHAVLEVTSDSPELKKDTRGSWTKFNQTHDPRTARRLSSSLQGHGTGWCTAGESTAAKQLQGGDFYVYYTRDGEGKDTVPRVAIRMQNGEVAEVRGVNANQNLEGEMADIAMEKLTDLPGGLEYQKKAEDMKHLTTIEKNADQPLSSEDLRFLYELDREIKGFGYEEDPRIESIQHSRDLLADIQDVLGTHDPIAILRALKGTWLLNKRFSDLGKLFEDSNAYAAALKAADMLPWNYVEKLKDLDMSLIGYLEEEIFTNEYRPLQDWEAELLAMDDEERRGCDEASRAAAKAHARKSGTIFLKYHLMSFKQTSEVQARLRELDAE